MKRNLMLLGITLLALLAFSFLAGSAFWSIMPGKKHLTISGAAIAHSVDIPASNGKLWDHYGGDLGGNRHSSAAEITVENVKRLEPAWEYNTGALEDFDLSSDISFTTTPIIAGEALVFCDPLNDVHALDPATGESLWHFDYDAKLGIDYGNAYQCRGVSQWRDSEAPGNAHCTHRIFMATIESELIALDAKTGLPCEDFGERGRVKVHPEMELMWPGEFQITSAPLIINDTLITGSSISDNARVEAPIGAVRAYDTRTGVQKWAYDPIPREGSEAHRETWEMEGTPPQGHANVWTTLSADEERGLVFLPTSSPSPDFYGGERPGANKWANSVVALKAETGEQVWGYQLIHHDIWDYDLPAQPGAYRVWRDGKAHDIIAQVTKTGHVFTLDRETGEPFHKVTETPAPQNGAPGEWLSPTQPIPSIPPVIPTELNAKKDAWGITYWDKRACENTFEKHTYEGLFTPPSLEGAIIYPFTGGGANWGSASYDEARNLLLINMNNAVHIISLFEADDFNEVRGHNLASEVAPQRGARFGMKRDMAMSPLGLPCNRPPWGVLAAVDLDKGEIVWRRPLGTTEDLAGGIALPYGTPSFGGPITTAGGLTFIAATMDNYLRAFDTNTGKELWKGRLPAGGQATPMTYEWEGKQYVVIAAGGHKRSGTTLGDSVIAFALPE